MRCLAVATRDRVSGGHPVPPRPSAVLGPRAVPLVARESPGKVPLRRALTAGCWVTGGRPVGDSGLWVTLTCGSAQGRRVPLPQLRFGGVSSSAAEPLPGTPPHTLARGFASGSPVPPWCPLVSPGLSGDQRFMPFVAQRPRAAGCPKVPVLPHLSAPAPAASATRSQPLPPRGPPSPGASSPTVSRRCHPTRHLGPAADVTIRLWPPRPANVPRSPPRPPPRSSRAGPLGDNRQRVPAASAPSSAVTAPSPPLTPRPGLRRDTAGPGGGLH